jgi:hypothetical protein
VSVGGGELKAEMDDSYAEGHRDGQCAARGLERVHGTQLPRNGPNAWLSRQPGVRSHYYSSFILSLLSNFRKAKTFGQMAEQLVAAIDDVFRVPKGRRKGTNGVWFDLDLDQHRLRKRFYPTNIFPLLLLGPAGNGKGIPSSSIDADRESNCRRVMEFLRTSGALNFKGAVIGFGFILQSSLYLLIVSL